MGGEEQKGQGWKGKTCKKVIIGWELHKKGFKPNQRLSEEEANTMMYIGDKKRPYEIDKKWKLLANLDEEFLELLDDAYNHITGFKRINADDESLSDGYIYATRYLVLELMREYGQNGLF